MHNESADYPIRVTVPLPADLATQLARFAAETDRSLAAVVRVALRGFLEGEGDVSKQ